LNKNIFTFIDGDVAILIDDNLKRGFRRVLQRLGDSSRAAKEKSSTSNPQRASPHLQAPDSIKGNLMVKRVVSLTKKMTALRLLDRRAQRSPRVNAVHRPD
jgi:hypothetical protein